MSAPMGVRLKSLICHLTNKNLGCHCLEEKWSIFEANILVLSLRVAVIYLSLVKV